MSDAALDDILEKARQNNERLDITGMLLYSEGAFFQVLEGERETVWDLYETIGQDPRHYGLILMFKRQISKRDFPNWSMGFARKHSLTDLPSAFFELSQQSLEDATSKDLSAEVISTLRAYSEVSVAQ